MISFFRRWLSSWIFLGILGLVLVAFIITGVNTPDMGGGGGGSGATIAKAGSTKVTANDLVQRVQNQFEAARREQPGLDQKTFLAGGAFENIAEALIGARALEGWGRAQGFVISKRLIDAQLAVIPAFRGVTGQFDEMTMRNALAQARISEKQMRADIASDLIRSQILTPIAAAAPASAALATPYARVLLEQRTGMVAIIPFAALVDPRQPSEAELAAAYKANIAAYTKPEARVLRYALFGPAQVAAQTVPTDDDIAAYYRENAPVYAAKESRTLSQVIAPSETIARAIATAARAGTSLAAAAAKAGLEAASLSNQSRTAYAGSSSDAIAGQVFSAAKGSVVGPIKGAFGWYVVRVDAVAGTAARPLGEVRPEIVAILTKRKGDEALADLAAKIEEAIEDGSSFAEVAANHKLAIVDTPAILSTGQAADQPDWKAPPELSPLLKTGFDLSADDRPTVETVTSGQLYAMLSVAKIIPPTPLPLAQVRAAVVRDIIVKRAAQRARAIAGKIVASVNRGVPLAKAMADTGVKLPPAQPARGVQLEMARVQQNGGQVPAPVRALFTLQKGKAALSEGDQGGVLFVTVLDQIIPGDLAAAPGLVDRTRQELARTYASELGEQFMRAVEADVEVTRDPKAIAAAKRQFAGQ
jgi:peptidyl-prolyl cis-trans isomerase D